MIDVLRDDVCGYVDFSMKNFCIRKAKLTDLSALVQFENESFTYDRISRKSFYHLLTHRTSEILIAKKNKKIIGSATLFFRKNSIKARLYSFAVASEYQGHGLSNALYKALENSVLRHQKKIITLEVRSDNVRAIQFYKKNYFEIFGTRSKYYEDGTDALQMIKKISYSFTSPK